jgi:beta-phosphoglucomutase-like phosphatase (HAD superfamily)
VKLQGILFDIDGTLVDSNEVHTDCWLEAFEHFGKTVDRDVMRHQIGKGGDLLVPDLLNAREMRTFGDELKEYRGNLYKKKYMKTVKPFPRASQSLRALHDRGIKLVFASSASPGEVEYHTQLLDAEDLIEGCKAVEAITRDFRSGGGAHWNRSAIHPRRRRHAV